MIGLKLATYTKKCHIAGGHFEQYFKLTGRTLYYADCSAVEAAHSLLRQSEEAHKTKTIHNHGSDNHLKRFKSSIVIFSSKNFGPDDNDDVSDIEFHELITEESEAVEHILIKSKSGSHRRASPKSAPLLKSVKYLVIWLRGSHPR